MHCSGFERPFVAVLLVMVMLVGGVERFDDLLAGFHEAEGFAGPVVELLGDRVEMALEVDG